MKLRIALVTIFVTGLLAAPAVALFSDRDGASAMTSLQVADQFADNTTPTTPTVAAPTSTLPPTVTTLPPILPSEPSLRCVVPKLKGRTLKQAKRALTLHHCGVGKIRHPNVRGKGKWHVMWQSARAGTEHPNGYRIDIRVR
jgi:hypothetical protein